MSNPDDTSTAAYRRLFLHSLLAFICAFLLATLIHEGAHAVTARAFGLHPVLHHNYVATSDEDAAPDAARLWVPASGPLASLLLAVACLFWLRRTQSATLVGLAVLWLAVHALIGFLGYLMLGPMVTYGDTGRVYAELAAPDGARWVIAIVAVAALMWILRSMAPDFERHVLRATPNEERVRGRLGNGLIAFPILAGTVVTTLLSLPVPTFISLVHPMTSSFAAFVAYGNFRRRRNALPESSEHPDHISIGLVVATLVLVAVSRALVFGLPLG